jgi:hypothetical protein
MTLITDTPLCRELKGILSLENNIILHVKQLFALFVLNERHLRWTQQLLLLFFKIILLSKLGRNMILSSFNRGDLCIESHFLRGARMGLPGCNSILRISFLVLGAQLMNYNIVSLMI